MSLRLLFLVVVLPLVLAERALVRNVASVARTFAFGPRLGTRRLLSPTRLDPIGPADSYRTRPERSHVATEDLPLTAELGRAIVLRRIGRGWTWIVCSAGRSGQPDVYVSLRSDGDEVVLEARRIVSPSMILLGLGIPVVLFVVGADLLAMVLLPTLFAGLAAVYPFTGLTSARRAAQAAFDEIEDALADMDEGAPAG